MSITSDQFCYFLKGFFEIAEPTYFSEKQIKIIEDHLNLVFNKVTPDRKSDMWKQAKPGGLAETTEEKNICHHYGTQAEFVESEKQGCSGRKC